MTDFGVVHRVRTPWPWAVAGRGYRARTIWSHAPLLARAVARVSPALVGSGVIHALGVWGWAAVAGGGLARRRIPAVYTTLLVEARAKRDGLTRDHGLGGLVVRGSGPPMSGWMRREPLEMRVPGGRA